MDDHKKVEKLFKGYEKLAKDDDLLNEAEAKVLGEYIDHHVEEETEMFPKARKAKMDPEELMSVPAIENS